MGLAALVLGLGCKSGSAALILSLPTLSLPSPTSDTSGSFDLVFQNTGAPQPLGDYQVGLQVTPSAGFSITGPATGADRPANAVFGNQNPFFSSAVQPGVLIFTDAAVSNPVPTIADGATLLRVNYSVKAGTVGKFNLTFFLDDGNVATGSPWDSLLDDQNGNPIPVAFGSGSITFLAVPEPTTFLLAAGTLPLFLIRRRRGN